MLARRILMLASACAVLLATADVGSAAQKKMVLVYSRTLGFRHRDAIEKGNPILKRLAEELGYRCVVSEDPSVFDPENVRKWDLMIFNNTTGRMNFSEPRRLKAFMDRIKVDGAGFMGFHAAADCFYAWPEYGEMLNAYFAGHPWNQVVRVRIEDPDHPLMKPFGKGPFVIRDEIYQFRNYKRSNVRVLMSIDPRSVDISRGRRPDRDYAMCWIRTWGKGRVYYCAHGHYGHVFENKTFQEHVKLAMQWAIGDIEVDTTPSKEIDRAALAAKAVETLKAATTDEDRLAALDVLPRVVVGRVRVDSLGIEGLVEGTADVHRAIVDPDHRVAGSGGRCHAHLPQTEVRVYAIQQRVSREQFHCEVVQVWILGMPRPGVVDDCHELDLGLARFLHLQFHEAVVEKKGIPFFNHVRQIPHGHGDTFHGPGDIF